MITIQVKQFLLPAFKVTTLAVLLVLAFANQAVGQSASPYSRYGLGTLHTNVFSANKGMGGLAAPYINTDVAGINKDLRGSTTSYINFANPASYASLSFTSFEVGANIDGANINIGDSAYKALNASLNHLAFVFVPHPRHNKWAISAGLLPYSSVNYNFKQSFYDSTSGGYTQVNTGRGALYQLYIGGAFKTNGFSIGANAGYTFGKVSYEKRIELPDSLSGYNTRNITNLNAKGFFYNVGVSYQRLIHRDTSVADHHKDIYIVGGLYGSTGIKLNAKVSSYWDRYLNTSGGIFVSDTVQYDQARKGKINMPFNIGAGLMFGNEAYWILGADFRYTGWKNFSSPVNTGPLANSWRISLGGQITPDNTSRKFLPRMQYRAGAYYGKSEITYNGTALNEYAGTIGLGIPLIKLARLNFAAEVGARATRDRAAVRENFYRFTFGIVLCDDWFRKPKLD